MGNRAFLVPSECILHKFQNVCIYFRDSSEHCSRGIENEMELSAGKNVRDAGQCLCNIGDELFMI